ncbi:MAG TPA: antitoxin MazE family protein [Pseudolabrys sp.]|jgi:hypothetical protein|nr:antitoxin MazE family protein [Pseudolabrys sp.]
MSAKSKRPAAPARAKAAARKASKPKSAANKASAAKSSREKVRAHRARMRDKGMRSITVWVPDVHSPKFAAEARRQSRLANKSPYAAEDQAWVNSMIEWGDD